VHNWFVLSVYCSELPASIAQDLPSTHLVQFVGRAELNCTMLELTATLAIQVFALGIVSVFDQILDEMDETEKEALFGAYVESLGESSATYRKDADNLAELAEGCSSPEDLTPSSSGSKV
jgi:hypothetical protein